MRVQGQVTGRDRVFNAAAADEAGEPAGSPPPPSAQRGPRGAGSEARVKVRRHGSAVRVAANDAGIAPIRLSEATSSVEKRVAECVSQPTTDRT